MTIAYFDLRPKCGTADKASGNGPLWDRLVEYHTAEEAERTAAQQVADTLDERFQANRPRWATLTPDKVKPSALSPELQHEAFSDPEKCWAKLRAVFDRDKPDVVLIDLTGHPIEEVIREATEVVEPGWASAALTGPSDARVRAGVALAKHLNAAYRDGRQRDPFAPFPFAILVAGTPPHQVRETKPLHADLCIESPERLPRRLLRELVDRSRGVSTSSGRWPLSLQNILPSLWGESAPLRWLSNRPRGEELDETEDLKAELPREGPSGGQNLSILHARLQGLVPPVGGPDRRAEAVDKETARRNLSYLFRLARRLAAWHLEGKPVRSTLVVSQADRYTELIEEKNSDYLPHVDLPSDCYLDMSDEQLRTHFDLVQSDAIAVYVDARTLKVVGVFSHKGKDDHTRSNVCRRLAKWCGGIVLRAGDGNVEVYDDKQLLFWHDSFEWVVAPFESVRRRLDRFFGEQNEGTVNRIIGAFACLLDGRSSSILAFVDDRQPWDPEACGLAPMRFGVASAVTRRRYSECGMVDGRHPIKEVALTALLGTLPVDGTHVVTRSGELIGLGYRITTSTGGGDSGGSGRAAAKDLSGKLKGEGFVIKVSGGGGILLFEGGRRVSLVTARSDRPNRASFV